MLIEVVWVPCIQVEGTSPCHASYFAHRVHFLVMVVMVMMLVILVILVMAMVMVMVEMQNKDSPLCNCVDSQPPTQPQVKTRLSVELDFCKI